MEFIDLYIQVFGCTLFVIFIFTLITFILTSIIQVTFNVERKKALKLTTLTEVIFIITTIILTIIIYYLGG